MTAMMEASRSLHNLTTQGIGHSALGFLAHSSSAVAHWDVPHLRQRSCSDSQKEAPQIEVQEQRVAYLRAKAANCFQLAQIKEREEGEYNLTVLLLGF
jgi:hypothetical protein